MLIELKRGSMDQRLYNVLCAKVGKKLRSSVSESFVLSASLPCLVFGKALVLSSQAV